MTAHVVQNSVLQPYVHIFVTDSLAMADSIRVLVDSTRITMSEVDTFTYRGSYKFLQEGPHILRVTGFSGAGDTTLTPRLEIVFAKPALSWVAISPDRRFLLQGIPGAVEVEYTLLVSDALLSLSGKAFDEAYRVGNGQQTFSKPIKVSMAPELPVQEGEQVAIYQLQSDASWQELPSIDEGDLVTAWTSRTGVYKLGPRTIFVPHATALHQNYPNPFNPSTTVVFDLGFMDGPSQKVQLVIYNLLGRPVRTLVTGEISVGHYEVIWPGVDDAGRPVASGIYFLHLATDAGHNLIKKMVLVR
jgi:hypothetical protein